MSTARVMRGTEAGSARGAVEWEVRLREGELDARELAAFEAWQRDEANGRAWAALQTRLARMRPGGAAERAAAAEALRVPSAQRRKLLRAGFGGVALALAGVALREGVHRLGLDADWQSAIGERRTVSLADGSQMTIDAGSRVYRVDRSDRSAASGDRVLRVSAGQVLVHMRASHAGLLRSIETEHGVVQTEGGTINVGRIYRHSVVAVGKGEAVVLQPGRPALRVAAGESVAFSSDGARRLAQPFDLVSAWTRGIFVADNVSLDALVDVFNRYEPGVIRVTGEAREARVSGVFLLGDIPRALTQVAESAPVRLTRVGPYLSVFS